MFRFWTESKKEKETKEIKDLKEQNRRLFDMTIQQLSVEELADIIERGNAACESLSKLANGCIR